MSFIFLVVQVLVIVIIIVNSLRHLLLIASNDVILFITATIRGAVLDKDVRSLGLRRLLCRGVMLGELEFRFSPTMRGTSKLT